MLGTTLALSGAERQVVGVLPEGIALPMAESADLYVPFEIDLRSRPRDIVYLGAVARLGDGRTLEEARERMAVLHHAIHERVSGGDGGPDRARGLASR